MIRVDDEIPTLTQFEFLNIWLIFVFEDFVYTLMQLIY